MASSNRRDLMAECNPKAAPLEVFTEVCCRECHNPECVRSLFGKSRFEGRVNTWLERLFTEVPRMPMQDPRFALFSAQKFLTIDVGGPIEVSSSPWFDPRDLEVPAPVARPVAALVAAAQPEPTRASAPVERAVEKEPQAVELQAPVRSSERKSLPPHMILANTQPPKGQMIGQRVPPPAVDKWAGPVSTTPVSPTDAPPVVIKTGATVKLGGSGV